MGDTIKQMAHAVCTKADDIASSMGIKTACNKRDETPGKKAILGYWNVRGIVGYIRLMLEYCNEPYEEKIYHDFPETMEKAKEMRSKHEGCEWYAEKLKTGMHFPNLPYLYIDGFKISQSRAILRYLARKHNLGGKNEQAKLDIDMVDETIKDFIMWHVQLVYFTPKPLYQTARQSYIEHTLPENLGQLSKFIDGRRYVAGDYVTYCDFPLYEYLDVQRMFAPEAMLKFENLMSYLERIEELPALKNYMQSERYLRAPVYAPFAAWDGKHRRESFVGGQPPNSGHPQSGTTLESVVEEKKETSLNFTAKKVVEPPTMGKVEI